MKLSVTRADPQDQAGVLNNAFWGVPVNPITTYKQSFYAKADAEALGPVTIRLLTDADDTVLASATVSGLTSQWKQYQFSLKAVAIRESSTNHLVLTIGHPGVVAELGFTVSTPRTTNAPTAIASTSWKSCPRCIPHSSVFLAGNYLEGEHIADRFSWKKTIGTLVDRPTHASPWRWMAWVFSSSSNGART